jgi:hypothetical protein
MPITSSSTSSSEAAANAPLWRGFTRTFVVAGLSVFALLLAFVLAVDPYDTGRFALLRAEGVPAQIPGTAHASRGRSPSFDAAILGNSHVQILAPSELTRETGIPFVSLAVPGTSPKETLTLLNYFMRSRTRPARALVIGIDPYWCRPDPTLPTLYPFPFWLYDASLLRYLGGIVREQSLDDSFKRLFWALGWNRRERARPDGLWDYDETFVWDPARHGPMFASRVPSGVLHETGRFPAIDALAHALGALPKDLPVVLLMPAVHVNALPEPGSALARSEAACWAGLVDATKARAATTIVDWRVDRPEVRVAENFIDPTHVRHPIARAMERDVSAAIRRLGAGAR